MLPREMTSKLSLSKLNAIKDNLFLYKVLRFIEKRIKINFSPEKLKERMFMDPDSSENANSVESILK